MSKTVLIRCFIDMNLPLSRCCRQHSTPAPCPTSQHKSTSRCANSETTTQPENRSPQSTLTTPHINHDHAIPPRDSNMSWFIKTIKAAGAVAVGAGAGGLFWLGSPATPYSNSTDPVASHALSAIATTFPSTLSSTVTSVPIIAFSSSTAIPNINGSHVVNWSLFVNTSDLANSSLTSFDPILATAAPSGSLLTLAASSKYAFYYLLNSTTRDVSPLLFALHNASNSMGPRVNEFVEVVHCWSSSDATKVAEIWLAFRPIVEDCIVDDANDALLQLLEILAKVPMGGRLVYFINTRIDHILECILLVIALIVGIIAAPCIMICMACQEKLQALSNQTLQDWYELGLLVPNRLLACTTRPAFLSLIGTEAVGFLYCFYTIASDSPNLWRCGQIVIGHYIFKVLVRQLRLPQSWRAFAHAFYSCDCAATIANQAAIIT